MRRTLAGVLFGLLFALSPAYPQTITASAQTTIVVNTTPVTGGSNGQCLTISSGTVGSGACGSGGGLTVGTSTITSGTTTRILYDNAGVLGEYTLTGSGTVAVMQTSPALVTPALGVATATSVAIGGCTIGTDVLCTTGTTTLNGKTTVAGASFVLSGNISAAAWTTSGIRYANVAATMTDTSSSGTVAAAYTDVFGGNTVAASSAATFTNYYGAYIKVPVAGTNVTLTNAWALGTEGINVVGQANSIAIKETGYSLTGSNASSLLDLSGTLNTTGSPDVVAIRITDTARGASTTLFNLYGGASGTTSEFSVSRNGQLTLNNGITASSTIQSSLSNNGQGGAIYAQNSNALSSAYATILLGNNTNISGQSIFTVNSSTNVTSGAGIANGTTWNNLGTLSIQSSGVTDLTVTATAITAAIPVVLKGYTVAGLPTGITGAMAYVTDAVACTFLAAPTGGGSVVCPVFYDGTSWKGA